MDAGRRRDVRALRPGARHQSPGRRVPRARAVGLGGHAAREVSAAPELPPARDLPPPGAQAGRRRARQLHAQRGLPGRPAAPELRLLRRDHDRRLVALGMRAGDHGGRGRVTPSSPVSTSTSRSTSTSPTPTATPSTAPTSPTSAACGPASCTASPAFATRAATCASPPACRPAGARCGSSSTAAGATSRSRSIRGARRSRSSQAAPVPIMAGGAVTNVAAGESRRVDAVTSKRRGALTHERGP